MAPQHSFLFDLPFRFVLGTGITAGTVWALFKPTDVALAEEVSKKPKVLVRTASGAVREYLLRAGSTYCLAPYPEHTPRTTSHPPPKMASGAVRPSPPRAHSPHTRCACCGVMPLHSPACRTMHPRHRHGGGWPAPTPRSASRLPAARPRTRVPPAHRYFPLLPRHSRTFPTSAAAHLPLAFDSNLSRRAARPLTCRPPPARRSRRVSPGRNRRIATRVGWACPRSTRSRQKDETVAVGRTVVRSEDAPRVPYLPLLRRARRQGVLMTPGPAPAA